MPKKILQFLLAFCELAFMAAMMVDFTHKMFKLVNQLNWLLLVNVIAWIVGAFLLVYEYRKKNSETFYTHHLFWSLSLIFDGILTFVMFDKYVRQPSVFIIILELLPITSGCNQVTP
jgi:uncharacterized membrane protein HdeD (DUF308 family)